MLVLQIVQLLIIYVHVLKWARSEPLLLAHLTRRLWWLSLLYVSNKYSMWHYRKNTYIFNKSKRGSRRLGIAQSLLCRRLPNGYWMEPRHDQLICHPSISRTRRKPDRARYVYDHKDYIDDFIDLFFVPTVNKLKNNS